MQVQKIEIDKEKARELYRKYREHQHYSTPIDHEIQRGYQLIAQGRMVIRAVASIAAAGLNEQGLPKLAICRADAKECWLRTSATGGCSFSMVNAWNPERYARKTVILPAGSLPFVPAQTGRHRFAAIVPLIPIHLRPKRALENYHILWEAEWTRKVPIDPYLLRRVGGDLWVVLAAWDLTEVERAVLQQRVSA